MPPLAQRSMTATAARRPKATIEPILVISFKPVPAEDPEAEDAEEEAPEVVLDPVPEAVALEPPGVELEPSSRHPRQPSVLGASPVVTSLGPSV